MMTKEEFQKRAKGMATLAKFEATFNEEIATHDALRAEAVEDIAKFDKDAAKIEAEYCAACKNRDIVEMKLAKHYASRIEK